MSSPPAISDLLAVLASRIQHISPENHDEDDMEASSSLELSISELNIALSLSDDSRVMVLDAALSLMCFKAPQVFDSTIEYLVKSVVSALSSSVACKVLRHQNEETLQIGSSILSRSSEEFVLLFKDIIDKLRGNGRLSPMLFQALVRSAASTSSYQHLLPFRLIAHPKLEEGRNKAVLKLGHLPGQSSIESHDISLRSLFWYLDPLCLKEDVSRILQDVMERPFLCLNKELFEKADWHDVVTCLVLSPSMFIKTRSLLHKWFLLTGLACIVDFLASLVTAIMDTISRPSRWGIPEELGSKLPFSDAYFLCRHQLLRILTGPLTSEALVSLACVVSEPVDIARQPQSESNSKTTPVNMQSIDDRSQWALAINFPDWFYFASAILFSEEGYHGKYTSGTAYSRQACSVEGIYSAAARYIAWVLNPTSEINQDSLTNSLIRVGQLWTSKKYSSKAHLRVTTFGKRKKSGKNVLNKAEDPSVLELFLEEFHNRIFHSVFECSKASASVSPGLQNRLLTRRVVIGILVGSSYSVTDDGCELLLHYVATGKILALNKIQSTGYKQTKGSSKTSAKLSDEFTKLEALEGARLVFNLTDTMESMSASISETEEKALEFIDQVRQRSSKYLVKCIDRLIQLHSKEEGNSVLNDLNIRLIHWRSLGREEPQVNKDLENVTAKLTCKLSSHNHSD
ncbi:PREDICTED: uncharacterized protein LOC104817755 [Tarenaya hassleriana]|uniref:uncharacterized protein LOC104817755 n=1 Tax=Tarenaya hassleriana TaxID=28532 RepID=UPI00053C8417|nr:PREDICTED: uncharacterized protein LOC104817755 [Tarenaya hassleriana]